MNRVKARIKKLVESIEKDLLERFDICDIDDIMLDIDELKERINELEE